MPLFKGFGAPALLRLFMGGVLPQALPPGPVQVSKS
jgi:hypothetical protein